MMKDLVKRITTVLPFEIWVKLKALQTIRETTMQDLVREIIEEYIKKIDFEKV